MERASHSKMEKKNPNNNVHIVTFLLACDAMRFAKKIRRKPVVAEFGSGIIGDAGTPRGWVNVPNCSNTGGSVWSLNKDKPCVGCKLEIAAQDQPTGCYVSRHSSGT
jgi:hypothetical protein